MKKSIQLSVLLMICNIWYSVTIFLNHLQFQPMSANNPMRILSYRLTQVNQNRDSNHTICYTPANSNDNKLKASFLRNLEFWRRAMKIYLSYKSFQVQLAVSSLTNFIGYKKEKRVYMKNYDVEDVINNSSSIMWQEIHEINSNRMMDLCLSMRGFYLKAGQFLGTRYDFMPLEYTSKLSKLHDNVPPVEEVTIREYLVSQLKPSDKLEDLFSDLDLKKPLGSASIGQVHYGTWKSTGEPVAVKIQYPGAENLMVSDLKNLRRLAEFLQRTELKFDILTCVKELQKRITNEFNFLAEYQNLAYMRSNLMNEVPNIIIPKPIYASKRVLVMSFVEGENLGRIAEFGNSKYSKIPAIVKKQFGAKLLQTVAKAWGHQIFVLHKFNSDPHPGNICISSAGVIGLLDWGQVCPISETMLIKYCRMIEALNSHNKQKICQALANLGIVLSDPKDLDSSADIAMTLLDTKVVPGYEINPFNPRNALKKNSIVKFPEDLYFLIRSVQLMRGIAYGFNLDFSLAKQWDHLAQEYLN